MWVFQNIALTTPGNNKSPTKFGDGRKLHGHTHQDIPAIGAGALVFQSWVSRISLGPQNKEWWWIWWAWFLNHIMIWCNDIIKQLTKYRTPFSSRCHQCIARPPVWPFGFVFSHELTFSFEVGTPTASEQLFVGAWFKQNKSNVTWPVIPGHPTRFRR